MYSRDAFSANRRRILRCAHKVILSSLAFPPISAVPAETIPTLTPAPARPFSTISTDDGDIVTRDEDEDDEDDDEDTDEDETEVMLVKWAFLLWVMLKGLFLGDPCPCPCLCPCILLSSPRISDIYLLLLLLLLSLSLEDLTESLLGFDLAIGEDTPLEEKEEEGVLLLEGVVRLNEEAVETVVAPEAVVVVVVVVVLALVGAATDPTLHALVLLEVTAEDEDDV
jgi:hypothetical protein